MSLLDNFALPPEATEHFNRNGVKVVELEDGVSRIMSGQDKGVAFKFFYAQLKNWLKSEVAGYAVFDDIEMIQWFVDKRHMPVERVSELPADLLQFNRLGECVGGRYREAYLNFKAGRATTGLALNRWDVLTDAEIASLNAERIYTVEQLADTPPERISMFPPQFHEARERAIQYVRGKDSRDAANQAATKLAELAKENQALKLRFEELEAKMKAAPIEAGALAEERRRPGRPKKVLVDNEVGVDFESMEKDGAE